MIRSGVKNILVVCCCIIFCNKNPVDTTTAAQEPAVSFTTVQQTANETAVEEYSSTEVQLVASLSAVADSEVAVSIMVGGTADSGADFTVDKNRFVFTPGNILCTATVVLVSDRTVEPAETAVFSLVSPVHARLGQNPAVTLVIEDKPVVRMLYQPRTVSRRSGSFPVTAVLSQHSTVAVTVPFTVTGTASSPAGHNLADGVFMFSAGDTVSSKIVDIVNDSLISGFRDIAVTLGASDGAVRGEDSLDMVTIAYDTVVTFQLLDNEINGWTLSPYETAFRVVTGEDFFTVINGGAQIFVQNSYTIALVENLVEGGGGELNYMVIRFGTSSDADSVFIAKTTIPDLPPPDITLPDYDTAMVVGYSSIGAVTVYARFGTTYMEVVVKGLSEDAQLLSTVKLVLDTLKTRLY